MAHTQYTLDPNLLEYGAQLYGLFNDFVIAEELTDNETFAIDLVEAGAGNTTIAILADGKYGVARLTTDDAENDGLQMQDEVETFRTDEAEQLTAFFTRTKLPDATQSDWLAGLAVLDTSLIASNPTDGIYFDKLDNGTGINVVCRRDSAENRQSGVFVMNTAWHEYGFIVKPAADDSVNATIYWYIDGQLVYKMAATNNPHDEALSRSWAYLTGAAGVDLVDIDYIGAAQYGKRVS